MTSVGNEIGQVVVCVLTTSEDLSSLQPLADGLINRYANAGQEPPSVLYVDRDCCSQSGPSKFARLFSDWDMMMVRLDVWHFMRRMARCCTSESHPLYGTFMARLSDCIFEWDADDFNNLLAAKQREMAKVGVPSASQRAVRKAIARDELARHCRRRTRGTEQTSRLIEDMILSLTNATDMLGVRLFRDEMSSIWETEKRHVACLQDPPGVSLYTKVGSLTKGDVVLPVYRCARGSTSLENFHLHLARFIPGTAANAMNFQAYLLEGLMRWNEARQSDAIDAPPDPLRCFDGKMRHLVNEKSLAIHGKKIFPRSQLPSQYTGELLGVEYLFAQSGGQLPTADDDVSSQIDEGFDDFMDVDNTVQAVDASAPEAVIAAMPNDSSDSSESEVSVSSVVFKEISNSGKIFFIRISAPSQCA